MRWKPNFRVSGKRAPDQAEPALDRPRISASERSTSASVAAGSSPKGRSSRVGDTALTPRQIARLGRSTPATLTSGRNPDGARELDSGTTTINSSSRPAFSSSTEITIAGRFLPASPDLAAPNATSQTSPRCGSGDAIAQRRGPVAVLLARRGTGRVRTAGRALRAPNLGVLLLSREPRQQRRH